jgi:hypothetical protein
VRTFLKTRLPFATGGRLSKDHFAIDLELDAVIFPTSVTVVIHHCSDTAGLWGWLRGLPASRSAHEFAVWARHERQA